MTLNCCLELNFFFMWVFFWCDAGETEIVKKIRDMEGIEEGLVVYSVDVLDYHSILEALKGCCALFCCLDSQEGYDVSLVSSIIGIGCS